ncbi:hypothetical protein [Halostagnicola sp. A56]|uniref:hypothetical protein n=1 Tax=Halostagnicola sp. A56 TaxID=1495067 RepID=UPI0012E2D823|nr:hypothetical protein [Halostagnicola sp. A56]
MALERYNPTPYGDSPESLAAITSISYLTLGIVDVYNSVPLYANIAVIVFLGVFIKFSGLVGTTKRWYQLTSPVKRFTTWLIQGPKSLRRKIR